MSEVLTGQVFREASEAIAVLTPTYDEIVAVARRRRRVVRRRMLAVVAALVVVIGAATWVTTRPAPSDPRPAPPVVRRHPNPVDVPWFANGELHLAGVAVRLPQPVSLIALNGGAAYVDQRGRVAYVAADGVRRPLGLAVPGSRLVGSSGEDWVAWLAAARSGGAEAEPRLVVHDVATDRRVGERQVPVDTGLVAIDQRRVFYTGAGTSYGWRPEDGDVEQVTRPGLADVDSAVRAYAVGGRVAAVQPFFSVAHRWPGTAPVLSPGGEVVLAAAPGSRPDGPFRPRLYDTRSGARLTSGLATGEVAVDASFLGGSGMLTYLVARAADLAGGSDLDGNNDPLLVLRVCQVGTAGCTDAAPVPTSTDQPMLAH